MGSGDWEVVLGFSTVSSGDLLARVCGLLGWVWSTFSPEYGTKEGC